MTAGSRARAALRPIVTRWPVRQWPVTLGRRYGIATERAVEPWPEPSPRGNAHVGIVLELLERTIPVRGDIAECGVFRGSTLVPIALFAAQHRLEKTVMGFDSFEGFDASVAVDVEMGGQPLDAKRVGGFSNTSEELVRQKLRWLGLESRTVLHKGYFASTLPLAASRSFSFVHLDCDLYESYRVCLAFFYERLQPNGIILFDEYEDPSWPGCTQAVDEFMAGVPEALDSLTLDNYRRTFIVKR